MPYEYALLRAVPRVDRGECVNVGVLVYCRGVDFLAASCDLQSTRVRLLDPDADMDALRDTLLSVERACRGEGPVGATSLGQRFRWLTAPRSSMVQTGPVHTGTTDDPEGELFRLLDLLVL